MRSSTVFARASAVAVASLFFLVATSCAGSPTKNSTDDWAAVAARVAAQMAAPDRHRFDLPKDSQRKPIEMYRALGVGSGMRIGDFGSGAGYNVELFAAAVGPTGKVWGHNTEFILSAQGGYYKRTMDERLSNGRLPNAEFIIADIQDISLDNELDIAYWGNNFHDYYHRDGESHVLLILDRIKSALKPGGVLGVTDHVGLRGRENDKLHRIEPELVIAAIEKAGFVIEEQSNMFRNTADDHSLNIYDDAIYRRTDRVFIKARKPK